MAGADGDDHLPGVIVDGAHNADGVARFVETVEDFRKENRIVLLFSAVADKQYEEDDPPGL